MKRYKLVLVMLTAFFLIPACTKDGSQEEKIRITIDKAEPQKRQERAPKAEAPVEKPASEPKKKEAAPQKKIAEPLPQRNPAGAERRDERAARPPVPDRSLDFRYVAERLDSTRYSRQQIKEFFLSIRGKRVSWAGTVFQAKLGSRGFKILVDNRAAPAPSGYNIVLVKKGASNTGYIAKGTDIRFSGVIIDISPAKPGSGPVVVLVDTRIQ